VQARYTEASTEYSMRIRPGLGVVVSAFTALALLAHEPKTITGKVVGIAVCGTLTVLDDAKMQHEIRLHGIDAPEKGQAFGTKARENLAAKVFGKTVRVEVVDVDRYRREVGRIYLGERFINLEMVRDGFTWCYVRYDKAGEFTDAKREAREKRRGLWADPNPVPLREFHRWWSGRSGALAPLLR